MRPEDNIKIGFNTDLKIWVLYVPPDFPKPYCSSCLNDIDKDKPFYFSKATNNFYCSKCMFKVDFLGRFKVGCKGLEREQEHLCIQKVEKLEGEK